MSRKHLKRLTINLTYFLREPEGRLSLSDDKDILAPFGEIWESSTAANRRGGN